MPWRNEYADTLEHVEIDTPDGKIKCVGASYDGEVFFVKESQRKGGREVVTHAFPFSDSHANDDVGKIPGSFTCSVYLVGINCDRDCDKLINALNKEGAYELVHPYYGRFNARGTSFEFNHVSSVQEYVEGSITFVTEQDPKKTARSVEDLRGVTESKSSVALDSSKADFVEDFSVSGMAKSVVDSVVSATVGILDKIEEARASVRSVSSFVRTISQIRENVQIALLSPVDFADRIQHLLTVTDEALSGDGENECVKESLKAMASMLERKEESSSLAADDLSASIDRLVLMTSASMAVKSVVRSKFSSADEALEMQSNLSEVFKNALDVVDDADDYIALSDLQAAALKYLRDEMANLAVIVVLPMSGSRDILSICYDCYGNLDRIDEILGRNGVADPLVITCRDLRVLSK